MRTFFKKIRKYFKVTGLPYRVELPYTHVVQVGDPVLRLPAHSVMKDDIEKNAVKKVIKIMRTIMINDSLTGISACQIGIPLSIIAFQLPQTVINALPPEQNAQKTLKPVPAQVWINPQMKILDYTAVVMPEMCSSILSLSAEVKRHRRISLTGLDEGGNVQSMEASDFLARIIQHEMDHLKGVMFTDIMNTSSLRNVLWKEINELNGYVELTYFPKA